MRWTNITTGLLLILLFGCTSSLNDKSDSILQNAIKAHGGQTTWDNASSLTYDKNIILFDKEGNIESNITQHHDYQLLPSFSGSIRWSVDTVQHEILYQGDTIIKSIDNVSVSDSVQLQKAYNTLMSAVYVVSQPFKLLDAGVTLTYDGREKLEGSILADVVKVEYDSKNSNHTKSDSWWYYFDVNSSLYVANMVNHGGTYSYIKNLKYDSSTAVVFNKHRKSYMVDKDQNIQFLRAEYFYSNYTLK